jgi:hypothetical protein
MGTRKAPRWVGPFLGALERTGKVEAAARDAGIDKTSAYGRRRAHADFASAWDAALARFRSARALSEEEQLRCIEELRAEGSAVSHDRPSPSPCFAAGPSLSREGRGNNNGRWSKSAEQRFFAALCDQANVKKAALAAGFSTSAIYQRRAKNKLFAAAWAAAVETGKARLQMLLIEAAEKSFDPELIVPDDDTPKVSAAEAIRILQTREGKERELARGQWEDEAEDGFAEYEATMDSILDKLGRLGERDREEKAEKGWTWCDEHRLMIPPGWVRDPGYVPPAAAGEGQSQPEA